MVGANLERHYRTSLVYIAASGWGCLCRLDGKPIHLLPRPGGVMPSPLHNPLMFTQALVSITVFVIDSGLPHLAIGTLSGILRFLV